jgi:hypothetical protein
MTDLPAQIIDGTHTRANVRALVKRLEECSARAIPVPEELARAVSIVAAKLVQSDSPRIKGAGAKLIVAALKHNLELAQIADKMARLDAGLATERNEMQVKFVKGTDGGGV